MTPLFFGWLLDRGEPRLVFVVSAGAPDHRHRAADTPSSLAADGEPSPPAHVPALELAFS